MLASVLASSLAQAPSLVLASVLERHAEFVVADVSLEQVAVVVVPLSEVEPIVVQAAWPLAD